MYCKARCKLLFSVFGDKKDIVSNNNGLTMILNLELLQFIMDVSGQDPQSKVTQIGLRD